MRRRPIGRRRPALLPPETTLLVWWSCDPYSTGTGHVTVRLPPCLAELTSPLVGVERQTCIGESLNRLVAGTSPGSPGAAICAAQALVAARVLPSCHYTAHAIGSAVWDYIHRSITITDTASLLSVVATALEYCTYKTCLYGCVHRIMVRMVVSSILPTYIHTPIPHHPHHPHHPQAHPHVRAACPT